MLESLSHVLLPSITLNLVAIATGVILGIVFKKVKRDCVTLGIEVGVQNSSMAILIAVFILDRPDYSIAAVVYGLAMYLGVGLLIFDAKRWPQQANVFILFIKHASWRRFYCQQDL